MTMPMTSGRPGDQVSVCVPQEIMFRDMATESNKKADPNLRSGSA